jgi:quercetin 2,3-dioxygenase
MINIRRNKDRGHNNYGWLDTNYTFSFNNYYDPDFMGFRDLRVINEDFIEPNRGFPTHGHENMEIISYVVSGELSHKDSLGNGDTILPHEIQRMSAGTGITHSEYSSPTDKTHLLQIWLLPEKNGTIPSYEQKLIPADEKRGKLKLIASRNADGDSITVYQDVSMYASILNKNEEVSHEIAANRHVWIQVVKGNLEVNSELLNTGDGAAISNETVLKINALDNETEFLLFDLR